MASENNLDPGVPGIDTASSQMSNVLKDFNSTVSDIISRSIITSSFNTKDRFDWLPHIGLRVSIPDRFSFMPFERAPAAELRNRLFPFPSVRGHRHKSAPQPEPLPDRSLAWWFAQLVHYGLPITCDREQAKESIKYAILQDRLFVPLRIQELESELKRRYVVVPIHRPGMSISDHPTQMPQSQTAGRGVNCVSRQAQIRSQPRQQVDKLSRRVVQNHTSTIENQQAAEHFSLGESSSSSDSDSSDSNHDNRGFTPKSGHLFTPRGDRIVRPVIYPGLLEREEEEKRKKQEALKQQNTEELRLELDNEQNSKRTKLKRPQAPRKSSHPKTDSDLASGAATDIVSEALDHNVTKQPVKNSSNVKMKSKEAKMAMTLVNSSVEDNGNSIWEMVDSDDHDGDGDDESESLGFSSPLSLLRQVSNDKTGEDDESVILSSWRPIPEVTRAKTTIVDKVKSAKPMKASQNVAKSKMLKPEMKTSTAKGKKPTSKASRCEKRSEIDRSKSKKPQSVIEISSDSSDSYLENLDDSTAEMEIILPHQIGSMSVPTKNSKKSRQVNASTRPASSPIRQVSKTISNNPKSLQHDIPEVTSIPNTVTVKPKSKDPASMSRSLGNEQQAATPNNSAQYQNVDDKTREQGNHKKHSLSIFRAVAKRDSLNHKRFNVPDLTGCGITEMSGGLGPGDSKAITESFLRRAVDFRDFNPITLRHTNQSTPFRRPKSVPRTPTLANHSKNPRTFEHTESISRSPDPNDSDDSIPSLTDLFTSQETPEPWRRLLKKNADARKQVAIEESYNPEAVPAMREALSSVPSYLKTFIRHDSPELFRTPAKSSPTSSANKMTKKKGHRERSRSASVAAVSRKRNRPSLLEIEAEGDRASLLKRPRLSASQYEPASAAMGLMRVSQTVSLPGSTPASTKPMETIAAKNGLKNSASKVDLKRNTQNGHKKTKRNDKDTRTAGRN